MTRKPLPKVIRKPPEGRQENGSKAAARKEREDAVPEPSAADAPSSGPQHDSASAAAEVPFAEILPPIADDAPATPVPHDDVQAERRRIQAVKIVDRHRLYAAIGGLLPLPVVNVAGVTAVILKMVKALSDLYGVPFERERSRSIIDGLMGGAVPTGFGVATASTLMMIPGAGFVGLAVSSVTAAACTRGIGMVFIDHFERTTRDNGGY